MDEMQSALASISSVETVSAQRDAALASQIDVLSARLEAVEQALGSALPATAVFEINADGNLTSVRLAGTPAAPST